ncbi:hypothetical protein EsH8_VI_000590 [Colletotrichum jinshuiense]
MSAILAYIKSLFFGAARGIGNVFKSIVDWLKMAYSPNPYWRGNMITALAEGGSPPFQGPLRMVISRVFQPSDWTVMEVAVMQPAGPPIRAALKVFDRRFSPSTQNQRLVRGTGEWSPELEEEFVEFVRRGAADDWVEYLSSEDFDAEEKRNKLQEEVERQMECEAAASDRLSRLQSRSGAEKGTRLPRAYATTSIVLNKESGSRLLEVRGILMEYVPGFSSDLTG